MYQIEQITLVMIMMQIQILSRVIMDVKKLTRVK